MSTTLSSSKLQHPTRPFRRIKRWLRTPRKLVVAGLAFLGVVAAGGAVYAHNLDAGAVYVYFDTDAQAFLDARIADDPGYVPPTQLLQSGDELGILIKAVPNDGTDTGVGGYTTFYVPNGVQVVDAAFVIPGDDPNDGISGWDRVPAHGQAAMPSVGAGGDSTVSLVGYSRGPNILGVTSDMVDAGNANLGTLPGVYGDIGIFYSTHPSTAFGSYDPNPDVNGDPQNYITSNSGDEIGNRTVLKTALNLWDTWQMAAYGISGTGNPLYPSSPIIDSNGRGYAPWGLASAVAGPESGYAWQFDLEEYRACTLDKAPGSLAPTSQCIDAATDDVGPWQRIKYPGSAIANDPPGANPADQPYVIGQGTALGVDLTATDLPVTVSQSDGVSPNAVRWAYGQLTIDYPEYAWVKLRILDPNDILTDDGCPRWNIDTFGGDAGGDSGGKDHIWRYYDPNSRVLDGCVAVGKVAERVVVQVGDNFQYKIKYYNAGSTDLQNVVITDTLPSGVTFVNSVPAQTSGPNPLRWVLGTILQGEAFEATVTVQAAGSGALSNEICVEGDLPGGEHIEGCSTEQTPSGAIPILLPAKSVTPTSVAPGGTVQYTIDVSNIGSGPSGNPVTITEQLPNGFTYLSKINVTANGADLTASTTVNSTDVQNPVFTVPSGIDAGSSLQITFETRVNAATEPGLYCNSFVTSQGGLNQSTGGLACVNVGGGKIGGNIFRDWDGDGITDSGDEGAPAVPVELYECVNGCGGTDDILLKSTTTDASGNYLFEGLAPDSGGTDYRILVDDGTDAGSTSPIKGYAQTANPDGANCGGTCVADDKFYDVNLTEAANESLGNDFGYQPAGGGAIGDTVWDDSGQGGGTGDDGIQNGTEPGLQNVTVLLYEDTNGNGAIDPDDQQIASDVTDATGNYSFTGLAEGLDYIVAVPRTDQDLIDYYGNQVPSKSFRISSGLDNPQAVPDLSGTYNDADFGFFGVIASNLGGRAYQEEDGVDGYNPAAGDVPIVGATVILRDGTCDPATTGQGNSCPRTTTDSNGLYLFEGLIAGSYVVDIVEDGAAIPTGYSPQRDNLAVTLAENEDSFGNDFPFTQLLSKTSNIASPSPGDVITYTITPNYSGALLLDGVTVIDPVPDGTTFVSAGEGGFLGTGDGSLTVLADKDTILDQEAPDQNSGATEPLITNGRAGQVERVLIEFDVSTIPAGATITKADLVMYNEGGATDGEDVDAHRVTAEWTEGDNDEANTAPNEANWTERTASQTWTTAGGDYDPAVLDSNAIGANSVDFTWDVKAAVQAWVDGDAVNYGLLLKPTSETGGDKEQQWASRDDATNPPELVIEYTHGQVGEVTWNVGSNTAAADGASVPVVSGSYTPAGTLADLSITGLGFQPDVVLIKAATDERAVMRTSSMSGDLSKDISQAQALTANLVKSLDSDGFTVGTDARVNSIGVTYHYVAFKESAGNMAVSTYTGDEDPLPHTISGIGFQPDVLFVMAATNQKSMLKTSAMPTTTSYELDGGGAEIDRITGFTSDGFTLGGNNATVNEEGITYHYVAFREISGAVVTDTFTGDGNDDRVITGSGFQPELVFIKVDNQESVFKTDSTGATIDTTLPIKNSAAFTDGIQELNNDGFEVGTDNRVNKDGDPVYWTAFAGGTLVATSSMSAAGALVSDGNSVTVTLDITSDTAVTGVTPSSLSSSTTGGATVGTCTGPTPASADITAGGTLEFTWSCPINAPTINGSATFSASASGTGVTFPTATSNSVLVTPPLTFTVKVDAEGGQIEIENTASIYDVTGTVGTEVDPEDSNKVTTPVRALIGDTVFIDWDQDGIQDPGEAGIDGVTVELDNGVCTPLPDGAADCPTTATVDGAYTFDELPPGDYTVNVISTTLPAGYEPVSDPDGTGTANTASLSLAESEANYDVDFGYRPTGGSSIGDTVFEDKNGNNTYQSGTDVPLANVTVDLYYDTNGNGEVDNGDLLYGSTETDFNGQYLFENLPAANFVVAVDTDDPNIATGLEVQIAEFAVAADGTSDYLANDFPFSGELPVIYKRVDKTTVDQAGDVGARTVTYALGINYSGGLLNNVKVTDEIPDGTSYVAASANLGGVVTDGVLEWNLGGNDPGTPGIYVQNKELFAFRGDDKQDFWKIDVGATTPAWDLTPTNTPTGFTVKDGGALTVLDGLVYGLRGDKSAAFAVYDPDTGTNGTWTTKSSTPAVVTKGGALTNDGAYIFAFAGDQTAAFWRYNPTANSWDDAAVADLPGGEVVDEGGALVFDGTNIYALQGNSVNFWRYNIATNTWTAQADFCDTGSGGLTVKEGGALVFDGTYIYAMGNNKEDDFCRYDRNDDSWTAMTDVPEGVEQGGALAFDGADIWATAGNGAGFYKYTIGGLGSWTASPSTPENVKWGGALAFVPSGNQTTTTLDVTPSVFSCDVNNITTVSEDNCPREVEVTMTVTNNGDTALSNVEGGSLTFDGTVGTGTATTSFVSGPDVTGGVSIAPGASQVFTYKYNVTADSTDVSEFTFQGSAFISGASPQPFAAATSPSALVMPALTFQALVDPNATVDPVVNIATLSSSNIIKLGPDVCYTVADSGDQLVTVDRLSPYAFTDIGATGTSTMEASTWNLEGTLLYGATNGQLYTLNTSTGAATALPDVIGVIRGGVGNINTPDVDGISFDPATGRLYAAARRESSSLQEDLLFQIDETTGKARQNTFGDGVDYVVIQTNSIVGTPTPPQLGDVDDLAFDRLTGTLFGIANSSAVNSGADDRLVTINKSTGAVSDVGRLTTSDNTSGLVDDMEGLSGFADGVLYAVTGSSSGTNGPADSFWQVDKATGEVTLLTTFAAYSDYESVACLDGPTDETVGLPPTPSNPVETYLTANIGDTIFNDLDGDGRGPNHPIDPDPNEPGISGVQVCVTNTGTPTTTVCDITDADGEYRLSGLDTSTYPGTWTVAVTADTAPDGLYPTTPSSINVTLASAQEYLDADFGYTQVINPSSIGDTVWLDADEDGNLDANEDGLEGVTVQLIDCGADNTCGTTDDFTALSTVTDENGNYLFDGLPTIAGTGKNYRVVVDEAASVTTPAGGSAILGDAADLVSVGGTPSTVNQYDVNIDPAGNDNETDADFGYNWTGSIGDFAWYDMNGDGVQDGPSNPLLCDNAADPTHECGAPNSTIVLYIDGNGDGEYQPASDPIYLVQVTSDGAQDVDGDGTVDPVGYYNFTDLPPGNYIVGAGEQEVPAPPSSPNAGEIATMISTTGSKVGATLEGGEDIDTVDFGFKEAALLEGKLFHDVNANGVLDPGEPPMARCLPLGDPACIYQPITVTLTGTDDFGNPVSLTTETDEDGEYKFLVDPGIYTVTYEQIDADIKSNLGITTTPITIGVEIDAGQEREGLNFGRDDNGAIGDRVWNDANGDGVQDTGEAGIEGITVQLFTDPNGDGDPADGVLLFTRATDASGNYQFIGLEDGNYAVQIAASNFSSGSALDGFDQTGGPTDPANPNEPPVAPDGTAGECGTAGFAPCNDTGKAVISSGNTDQTLDFGYQLAGVTTYGVSGNVWDDNGDGGGTGGNGIQDGTEPDLENVTVTVEVDADNDGTVDNTYTVQTNAGGDYSVSGIPAGSKVTVTVDTSTLPGASYVQTGDPDESGTCTTCDSKTVIANLSADETGLDFGYQKDLGSIAGAVCDGGDGTLGLCDGSDTPIADVTVYLTYAGADGFLGTPDDVVQGTVTCGGTLACTGGQSTGDYLFDDLEPGLYQIIKTNPADKTDLADADGGNPNNISVNLAVGQNLEDQDFEVQGLSGVIGDRVWLDTDRDGIDDNGEPGLANVSVELAVSYPVTNGQVDINGADAGFGNGIVRGIRIINGEFDMNGDGVIDANDTTGAAIPGGGTVGTYFGTPVVNGRLDLDGNGTANDNGATGGDTIATEITNLQGKYLFRDLPAGDYAVLVNEATLPYPDGALQVTAGTVNPQAGITLAAGGVNLDVDFGYVTDPTKGMIGNFVWSDADSDGEQGTSEPGIGGVTLLLTDIDGNPVDDPNNPGNPYVVTTDADGSYAFINLIPGTYKVQVTDDGSKLTGYSLTEGEQSSTDPTAAIVLIAGTMFDKADFGYDNPNLNGISDRAWYDADRDGLQDPAETGIPGVSVELIADENGDGIVDYEVIFGRVDINGDGIIDTNDNGTLDGVDIVDGYVDVNGAGAGFGDGTFGGYPVIGGVMDLNASGSVPANLGSISDQVWIDTNGNGSKSATEPRLPGVTVYLDGNNNGVLDWADGNGNGVWDPGEGEQWTSTDANGTYILDGLAAGSYNVKTVAATLPSNLTGTTAPSNPVALSEGQKITTADFGYQPATNTAVIGDRIWSDADGDGVQDSGEVGIGGVKVELQDGVCTPGVNCPTATTAADGSYLFTNVPATGTEDYTVVVDTTTLPAGYAATPTNNGGSASRVYTNLSAADVIANADWGFEDSGGTKVGIIGDTVFNDANGNGVQDADEPGIQNVTVDLYTDPNKDGNPVDGALIATVTTSASGTYNFSGLPVDAGGLGYVVQVSDTRNALGNTVQTADPDETGPCVTCNSNGASILYTTGTATGPTDDTVDFGYYAEDSGSISPEPVIASTFTDENGDFNFDGLADGDYGISISDTAGKLTNLQGTTLSAQDGELGVTVSGADVSGVNFGYAGLGPIGDTVFSDNDGDGVQDAGELGIPNVAVKLYLDNGDGVFNPATDALVSTETTDGSGKYAFTDLPAGTFWVSVDDTQAAVSSYTPTTTDADTGTANSTEFKVILTSSEPSFLDADFGYQNTALADVSGTVWRDKNRNGVINAGEPLFGGVTVDLLDNNGVVVATTTTDADGNYTFPDVPPNLPSENYTVVVTDVDDVLNGFFLTSGLDEIEVTVGGSDVTGIDFGYARKTGTGSIGDTVWLDTNADGVQSQSEPGVSGVEVSLYKDRDGDGAIDTTIDLVVVGASPNQKLDTNGNGVIDSDDIGSWYGVSVYGGGLDVNRDGKVDTSDDGTVNGYLVTDGAIQTTDPAVDGAWAVKTTDGDGGYQFAGLPAGSYAVVVDEATLPSNVFETTYPAGVDPSAVISLSEGGSYQEADFGYVSSNATASIGNRLWLDVDGDGVQDPGEPGLPGVTVVLRDGVCTPDSNCPQLTTGPDGDYLFTGLDAGTYEVAVIAGLPTNLISTTGGNTQTGIAVAEGAQYLDADFGYTSAAATAVIGDFVWRDADGDGVQDAGETGIGGVTVELLDGSGTPTGTTTTAPDGSYLFTGVAPGDYQVRIASANFGSGQPLETYTVTTGADSVGADTSATFSVAAGESKTDLDFGYDTTANLYPISDTVWSDADGDGVRDSGENGIAGVTVVLRDSGGNVIASTTTDANGEFSFPGVPDGDYTIEISDTDGVLNGRGTTTAAATAGQLAVTVSGGPVTGVNFGYIGGASLGDFVWKDVDGDGLQDPGEIGIEGVKVVITDQDTNEVVAIVTTDRYGKWLATGLPPGDYVVFVDTATLPTGVSPTPTNLGGGDRFLVSLQSGDALTHLDFGYEGGVTGSIGDLVWLDSNGDGVFDAGEPPLPGREVRLYDPGPDGIPNTPDDILLGQTITDPDGGYSFRDLLAGEYYVKVQSPTPGGLTPTSYPAGYTGVIDLAGGEQYEIADFGYAPAAGTGVIGDRVWHDADNDQTEDAGEPGLGGVDVHLCLGASPSSPCTASSPDWVATTTTDANGGYLFSGLAPTTGSDVYAVQVDTTTLPAGYGNSVDVGDGTADGRTTTTLVLDPATSTAVIDDLDFGYYNAGENGTVDGTVYRDLNGDGDPTGEPGIAGVTATLIGAGADGVFGTLDDAVFASTVTDANGDYGFDGLPLGTAEDVYAVRITDVDGKLIGLIPTEVNDGALDCSSTCSHTDVDFGYQPPTLLSSIGDTVWLDTNGNGLVDAGEGPLPGVTVYLCTTSTPCLSTSSDLQATATTGTDGKYQFGSLGAGTYYVGVESADVSALTGTTYPSGTTDPITLVSGEAYRDADFGYRPVGSAVIGDRVWNDVNGNGVQDAGEAGIGGVTVDLKQGTTVIATVTTAADGSYRFDGVTAGSYDVVVDTTGVLSPYTQTGDPDESSPPACTVCDDTTSVTVADGDVVLTADFGYQNLTSANGSIGDTVYNDIDGDGSQGPGEGGIAGVTVQVYDSVSGDLVGSAVTDADGQYTVAGLPAGSYDVVVADINGVLAGQTAIEAPTNPITITCSSGCDQIDTADFGFGAASGRIGDTVYFDANGDGDQDAGELGIENVTVNLLDVNGNVVDTKTTDANGVYNFSGLEPGDYTVEVTDLNGVLATLTQTQVPTPTAVTIACSNTTTPPCTNYVLADAGYAPTTGATGTLGGTIWRDTIKPGGVDGTLQPGEPGIGGVTVELWLDVDGNGTIDPGTDNLVRTEVTNANGDYLFLGIPPGDYWVRVPDDDEPDVAGNLGANAALAGLDSIPGPLPTQDDNGHLNPYQVTLPPNTTDTSIDFAYDAVGTSYEVSGTVFEDNGGAGDLGVKDGPSVDPRAPGATVTLYRVVDGVEYEYGTTTTDVNGDYSFVDLPPNGPTNDTYRIEVSTAGTIVDGMEQTADPDEPGVICSTSCDSETTFTLSADKTGVDFGYWNGGTQTTPVTLSYFQATGGGGWVSFEWATATETGNLGFNLYARQGKGRWQRVNEELIRSKVISSVERQTYSYEASGVEGDVFAIEDIDIFGKKRKRGPFALDQSYGVAGDDSRAIDWKAIGKEHEAKKNARKQKKKDKMKKKHERKLRQHRNGETASWLNRAVAAVASALIGVAAAAELPVTDTGLLNLEVSEAGLHRLTHEQLLAAGADLSGMPVKNIALSAGGEPVPLRVQAGKGKSKKDKRKFGPGGYIEFVGAPLDTLYTKTNVYVLRDEDGALQAGANGRKVPRGRAAVPFYLETGRVEKDLHYAVETANGDPWFEKSVLAWGGPGSDDSVLAVDAFLDGYAPVMLTVDLWGGIDDYVVEPDHHVRLRVNGVEVTPEGEDGWWFEGLSGTRIEIEVPAGTLHEGDNTLTIELPADTGAKFNGADVDLIGLDSYAVTYPRRFVARDGRLSFTASGEVFEVDGLPSEDVVVHRIFADGGGEVLMNVKTTDQGGSYRARFVGSEDEATYYVSTVDALHEPVLSPPQPETDISSGEATYLIVSHPDFMGDAMDTLVSMRVAQGYTVKVVDVEDIYAQFGFGVFGAQPIRDYIAYAYANLGTRMVLLVGGDTYDYLDTLGHGAISFVPTLYGRTGNIVRVAPVDALYADVDEDNLPDLAIGRLPVRSEAELGVWVQKSAAWEVRQYGGTAVFAADGYDDGMNYSFSDDSDHLMDAMPAGWDVRTAYIDDKGVVGARDELTYAINNGVTLTSFFGHSGLREWSFSALFTADHAAALTNSGQPTVVTQWGCWNTYYVSPKEDTMGHEFLLNGDKGAVAVLGASTLTDASAEREISTVLFDYLLTPGTTLGDAVLQAKRDYAETHPEQIDIILGWNLLGDPAQVVAQPE